MSFLDNLENSLKTLEGREERDPRDAGRREEERSLALAAAPWAEKLKDGPFTEALLVEAARAGHKLRAKIYIAWLGTTLRLEMRERKLDLRPTPDGIVAAFIIEGGEQPARPVDLGGNPGVLLDAWIAAEPKP